VCNGTNRLRFEIFFDRMCQKVHNQKTKQNFKNTNLTFVVGKICMKNEVDDISPDLQEQTFYNKHKNKTICACIVCVGIIQPLILLCICNPFKWFGCQFFGSLKIGTATQRKVIRAKRKKKSKRKTLVKA
jgi:hypothetical protein